MADDERRGRSLRARRARAALTIVFVASALLFLALVRTLFTALLLGAMGAVIGYPGYQALVRLLRGQRRIAALFMSLGFTVLFLTPIAGLVLVTVNAASEIVGELGRTMQRGDLDTAVILRAHPGLSHALDGLNRITGGRYPPQELVRQAVQSATSTITSFAGVILAGATQFSLVAILVVVSLYYFFLDGEALVVRLRQLSPLRNVQDRELFRDFEHMIHGVVYGVFVAGLLQGAFCGVVYWILGVGHPALLTGLTAFAAFLPLGSAMIWGPLGIIMALTGEVRAGVILLVVCTGIVILVDNVIRPYLIRGRIRMHPLLVFIGLFGGFEVFGLFGVFIGPLVVSVFLTLLRFVEEEMVWAQS